MINGMQPTASDQQHTVQLGPHVCCTVQYIHITYTAFISEVLQQYWYLLKRTVPRDFLFFGKAPDEHAQIFLLVTSDQ